MLTKCLKQHCTVQQLVAQIDWILSFLVLTFLRFDCELRVKVDWLEKRVFRKVDGFLKISAGRFLWILDKSTEILEFLDKHQGPAWNLNYINLLVFRLPRNFLIWYPDFMALFLKQTKYEKNLNVLYWNPVSTRSQRVESMSSPSQPSQPYNTVIACFV